MLINNETATLVIHFDSLSLKFTVERALAPPTLYTIMLYKKPVHNPEVDKGHKLTVKMR